MSRTESALFTCVAVVALGASVWAKDHALADYDLKVHVVASGNQVQMEYRGTDCTSATSGDVRAVESDGRINGTINTRTYTTCDPNWAAHHTALAEADINAQEYVLVCADMDRAAAWAALLGAVGNAGAAAGGTPDQKAQAQQNAGRAQPIPPAAKCTLPPGIYPGRWFGSRLELLLVRANGKYETVSFNVAFAREKQQVSTVTAASTTSQAQSMPQPVASSTAQAPTQIVSVSPASSPQPAVPSEMDEMKNSSLVYLDKKLHIWTAKDADSLLGKSVGYREGVPSSPADIFEYRDPTRQFRSFELSFSKVDQTLEGIYAYPWALTWEQCKRVWGSNVRTIKNADGTRFYVYKDRQLNIRVNKDGEVLNLGLY